jgi:hypothetical protein
MNMDIVCKFFSVEHFVAVEIASAEALVAAVIDGNTIGNP